MHEIFVFHHPVTTPSDELPRTKKVRTAKSKTGNQKWTHFSGPAGPVRSNFFSMDPDWGVQKRPRFWDPRFHFFGNLGSKKSEPACHENWLLGVPTVCFLKRGSFLVPDFRVHETHLNTDLHMSAF